MTEFKHKKSRGSQSSRTHGVHISSYGRSKRGATRKRRMRLTVGTRPGQRHPTTRAGDGKSIGPVHCAISFPKALLKFDSGTIHPLTYFVNRKNGKFFIFAVGDSPAQSRSPAIWTGTEESSVQMAMAYMIRLYVILSSGRMHIKPPESLQRKASGGAIIPTRKMKLNSKRFCLGDLISFDFS